ncbi:glucan endo-1,3-beta-glucosidase 14 [Cocos nucifera]|uniref:Glucan endo-1,3-beta-glucosidase 14 n=1 Tax=Cocos nucifera TaxID=13894 RepID=A0A8K0I4H1_COCNU|nr:glucan endo-1,3-beta-glucosidase 14 [Cocos nucifera]
MASSSTAPALLITILIIVIPCSFFLLLFFLFSRRQLRRLFPVSHSDKKKKTKMMSGLLFFVCFCLLLVLASHGPVTVQAFTGTYGINYGRIANNIPPPENVVILLKAAKIKNVRIYDADHSVLSAFKGSGLELVVSIPNEYVIDMSVNEDRAMEWLKENVQPFLPDTHIRGIAVGNEVLGGSEQELAEALLGAIKNVYGALERLQLTGLIETGAPFYINAYPFLAYKNDPEHIDIKYALFKPNSGVYDAKTGLHYDNMLDAQIDAAYAALEAAGYDKMEVLVSETGWASAGDENEAGATVQNARTYNFNLRKRLFKKKGTPLRPKIVVKAYCFALFNENLKPGPGSERHFGLFKADGSIAYNIGFRGLKPSGASRSLLSLKYASKELR